MSSGFGKRCKTNADKDPSYGFVISKLHVESINIRDRLCVFYEVMCNHSTQVFQSEEIMTIIMPQYFKMYLGYTEQNSTGKNKM